MKRTWEAPFRYIVLTALLILFAALLWYIREIFRPLLTAALIAFVLSPAVDFCVARFHLRHKSAARIVYIATIGLLLLILGTVMPILSAQIKGITTDFRAALLGLESLLSQPLQIGSFGIDFRLLVPSLHSIANPNAIAPQPSQALRFLQVTSRSFLWLLVIFVTTYYLMTDWGELRDGLIRLAPKNEQADLRRLYARLRDVWTRYLRGQIRLVIVLAVIYAVAWQLIGLPGALLLGVMVGVLNLVPELGPAAVAILATLVAFLEGSNFLPLSHLWFALLTLGVYIALNTFKNVWLQPRILGQSVLLHEGIVFVAIIAAIVLQGVLGALIVVPLLASAMIVGRYVRRRLLGLPPFDDEETEASPPGPPAGSGRRPRRGAASGAGSAPRRTPARKKGSK